MVLVPLNVSAVWRPWQQAGLSHLLLEEDEVSAVQACLAERRQPAPLRRQAPAVGGAAAVTNGGVPAAPPPHASPASQRASTPASGPASGPASPARTAPTFSTGQVAQAGSSPTAPQGGTTVSAGPAVLHPDQWPEAWTVRLRKTPPRPRLVWSYGLLAQDLAGMGEGKLRGEFFRALFAELGMPQGSHALWPLNALPLPEVEPVFFVSGLEVLKPETVVFMGEDDDPAFEALHFPRVGPLCSAIWRGRRFVRLHSVERLREDLAPRHNSLLSLLKAFHRPRG